MWKIDCAHSRILKMLPWLWFREIRVCIEAKIQHVLISLNQGQGSVFKLRESILRMKLPQKYDFEREISTLFDFCFNTYSYFPESESSKHFHASRMHAIDFSHDFTPTRVIFVKINFFSRSGCKVRPL